MDLREMVVGEGGRPGDGARHPWEQSRARFFVDQLGPHLRAGLNVLDVGAGDAYLAASLARRVRPGGQVICFDTAYSDEHLARFAAAAPEGLAFTRHRPRSRFDIVLLLDVLEHVPDDRALLADVVDNLVVPGGMVLASVPAHPALFTHHDVMLGHHRRYRPRDLRRLLRDTGLDIMRSAGLFHSLLPVRMAEKSAELLRGVRARPVEGEAPDHASTPLSAWKGGRWLTAAVVGTLAVDNRLSAACARWTIGLPGLSVWALARKR